MTDYLNKPSEHQIREAVEWIEPKRYDNLETSAHEHDAQVKHQLDTEYQKNVDNSASVPNSDSTKQLGSGGMAETIVEITRQMAELFLDCEGNPCTTININGKNQTWFLHSTDYSEWIGHTIYTKTKKSPKRQQLSDAINTLNGIAKFEGNQQEVHLRVANDGDSYIVDLGDETHRAISIQPGKWKIIDSPKQKFRRTKNTKPLFEPAPYGTANDLAALVNIEHDRANKQGDLPMLVACILESLRPDTAFPIMEFCGEQGSGKSTTHEMTRRFIDPTNVNLKTAPKNVEDIFVSARNNHAVSYNNLSKLSADMQDALCTLSTGGGYASRRLYTNTDEITFDSKRPVLINGIVPLATRPDLLSRIVHFECPPILSGEKKSDKEITALLAEKGPKAMRFLLDTFAEALALLPLIKLSEKPRLLDFATFGEAISQTMGYESDAFLNRYNTALKQSAEQSIEGSPVIEAIVNYIKSDPRRNKLTGTAGEVLRFLRDQNRQTNLGNWPTNARGFRGAVDRAKPVLRQMGIEVSHPADRRNGRKINIEASERYSTD